MAADTTSEARVPVNLALFKLNLFYYYTTYPEVRIITHLEICDPLRINHPFTTNTVQWFLITSYVNIDRMHYTTPLSNSLLVSLQYFAALDLSSLTGKLDAALGAHWDVYLMSLLIGLVVLLLVWRRRT